MENGTDSQFDNHMNSQTDAYPISKRKRLDVLPALPTELKEHDLFYSMKRPERGLALIFNHEFYDEIDGKPVESRHGTSADVECLYHSLSDLGFQVDAQHNLTKSEIMRHVSEVSRKDELNDHDCLLVFVLTHGEEKEQIYAKDRTYYIREIIEPFIGTNCLQLVNKPKLFFIQACKGIKMQNAVNLRTLTDGKKLNSPNKKHTAYSIPENSDVLISYATIEGYIALRDPSCGTPYVGALCNEFDKNGTTLDLLSMLIRVHHRLATSTYRLGNTNQHIKVQASFLCYLNRFVKFDTPTFSKAQTQ